MKFRLQSNNNIDNKINLNQNIPNSQYNYQYNATPNMNLYNGPNYPMNPYPPNKYPPNQYPPNLYPLNLYPSNQYPPNQYMSGQYTMNRQLMQEYEKPGESPPPASSMYVIPPVNNQFMNCPGITFNPNKNTNYYKVNNAFYFVDLPGYGYAKVSKEIKAKWGKMIEKYLKTSEVLKKVFLLVQEKKASQKKK